MGNPMLDNAKTTASVFAPPATITGPLLVASTGAADSDSAITAARLFAERSHTPVQVLTVVTPIALGYTMGVMPLTREIDASQRDTQLAATRSQLARLVDASHNWPVSAEFGDPADTIATAAVSRNARMIVLGHGYREAGERDDEHVLQTLQRGETPVFAARAGLAGLPSRVIIATDFSELSAYAAQFALAFLAPDARIHLVNVIPDVDARGGGWEHDWADAYRRGLDDAFATSKAALAREQFTIESVALTGNAAEAVLRYAAEIGADLIVCANHGHGLLRRLFLGSVATTLVRNAQCSVLCVPGSALARTAARSTSRLGTAVRRYNASEWADALDGFSKRNEGRLCTVEIDELAVGAQPRAVAVPFLGSTYESRGNRVTLMLGDARLDGRHVTNAIPDVTEVDVMVDAEGEDSALRVANVEGQTLVTFAPSRDWRP